MLTITSIAGVKVIEQDVAYGPHPRWRNQQVPYRGIAYVILEDGRSGYACETCGYLHDKIASVASHLNAHGDTINDPLYPVETLKALIRSVKRAKQAGHRNYCEIAAADLNRRGIKTMDGSPWQSVQVSRLFKHWVDRISVSLPPIQRVAEQAQVKSPTVRRDPARANAITLPDTDPLVKRMIRVGEKLQDLTAEWESVVSDISIALAAGSAIDPEIVEKAAKWDALDPEVIDKAAKFDAAQSLFGGGK